MTVGDSSLFSGESYLSFGRETTYGTGVTASAGLDFISCGLKMQKDSKILEQVERKRTMSKSLGLGRNVGGDVAFYMSPGVTACTYLLQNAFGGTVTSATTTIYGTETVGGLGFDHIFEVGSMDQTYKSLSASVRKGPLTTGKIYDYSGLRVNTMSFVAEIDDALKCTVGLIGKDVTITGTDLEAFCTATAFDLLSFADGRVSVEGTFASLTSTSFWHVHNVNFSINNNLKSDAASRRIGTDTLAVLPIGVQSYDLSLTMRFDTTTAYAAMLAQTELACQLHFQAPAAITGSVAKNSLRFNLQKLIVKESGDPEISGPDNVILATVAFNVLRDESATGYAVKATLTNNSATI